MTAAGADARSDALLVVSDLVVALPTPAGPVTVVDGVSFTLDPGRRLGIVGESGSGKSVLGRSVMGLTSGRSTTVTGRVVIAGQSVLDLSPRRRRALWGRTVAMVFQDPLSALHPMIPVGEQVAEAVRRIPATGRQTARNRAVELLDMVGIARAGVQSRRLAHEFSGGMRQRVAIAMAVAGNPRLLIADEPTTALDVTVQSRILALFDELCTRLEIGLVMISHDLAVVSAHTDDVAVMYGGRLVETGPAQELFRSPRMRYTEALLDAIPRLPAATAVLPRPIPGHPPSPADRGAGCTFVARCAHASDRCGSELPPLEPAGTTRRDHAFACWHPVPPRTVDDRGRSSQGRPAL